VEIARQVVDKLTVGAEDWLIVSRRMTMRQMLRCFYPLIVICVVVPAHLAVQQPPPVTPLNRLQANIERITRSVNAKWGIYIKCIETGEEIAINADETMDTMSVIKIPLMAEVFRQIEAGKFSLSDRVTLK
jgi:hypothetical protein